MRRYLASLLVVGCEHGQTPANPDGAPTCRPELQIEGALLDWDAPTGVGGATLTQRGGATAITASDGLFSLCAQPASPFVFDVAADPHLSGTLLIEPNALQPGAPLALRTLTPERASSFFGERGLVFDPGAAQLVVLQTGDRSSLTLTGVHDAPQQGEDAGTGTLAWTAGEAGRYVLFPNVAPASSVQLSGDPRGPRPIPAVAGQVSLAVISFVFE